jgi:hypothetical protein
MIDTYAMVNRDFPYYLFDYQVDGKDTGEQLIQNEEGLRIVFDTIIPTAMEQKRKLVIYDDLAQVIFYIEDGTIVFPSRELYQAMQEQGINTFAW